jgi:hypothetical protein
METLPIKARDWSGNRMTSQSACIHGLQIKLFVVYIPHAWTSTHTGTKRPIYAIHRGLSSASEPQYPAFCCTRLCCAHGDQPTTGQQEALRTLITSILSVSALGCARCGSYIRIPCTNVSRFCADIFGERGRVGGARAERFRLGDGVYVQLHDTAYGFCGGFRQNFMLGMHWSLRFPGIMTSMHHNQRKRFALHRTIDIHMCNRIISGWVTTTYMTGEGMYLP